MRCLGPGLLPRSRAVQGFGAPGSDIGSRTPVFVGGPDGSAGGASRRLPVTPEARAGRTWGVRPGVLGGRAPEEGL